MRMDVPPKKCATENLVILHNKPADEGGCDEEEQIHRGADNKGIARSGGRATYK